MGGKTIFWANNFRGPKNQNLGVRFSIFWESENYLGKIKKMRVIFSKGKTGTRRSST